MAQLIADRRDVDFVLHEQLKVEELARHERFAEFNRKAVDLIISEARNLAIKEILPTRQDGDRQGARFDGGKVFVPESFHKAWKAYKEGEWLAMTEDPDWGGQGMPRAVAMAAADYLNGANFAFMMYAGLTHGAGKLVESFGTEKLKKLFLKRMYSGEWTGTMLLTEPEAGSDVGALTTSAVKNPDGTYSITGNKIFISSGEHDLVENIIHPVLARIDGAPAGTAGISLFLVPKIWVNDDGSLGRAERHRLHRHRGKDGHPRQRHLLDGPRQQGPLPRDAAGRGEQGHARDVSHDERSPPAGGLPGPRLRQPGLHVRPGLRARTRPGAPSVESPGQECAVGAHHPAPGRPPHADAHEGPCRGHAQPDLLRRSPGRLPEHRRRPGRRRPSTRA